MKAVLQRASYAHLNTDGTDVGELKNGGLVVLFGVEEGDTYEYVDTFVSKIANLRIFSDADDKMNLSLLDTGLGIMVVPNFTLAADCRKGRRPSFAKSGPVDFARNCFLNAADGFRELGISVVAGTFGSDMKVNLINDGPVTIVLDSKDICK